MPKVLGEISQRILDTAIEHFKRFGYQGTDMKSIAGELEISVGTLYNYHKSKPELFVATSKHWRSVMAELLQECLALPVSPREKVLQILTVMEKNAEGFIGLWKEFMLAGESGQLPGGPGRFQDSVNEEERRFHEHFCRVIAQAGEGRPGVERLLSSPDYRFSQTLFSISFFLAMRFPGQDAANRAFLADFVEDLFTREDKRG